MAQKNGGGGIRWVVQQKKLEEVLNFEKGLQTRMLTLIERVKRPGDDPGQEAQLQAVKQALKTWFRMYHNVVLLGAARSQVGSYSVNTDEEGEASPSCPPLEEGPYCLPDSLLLPPFGLEEDNDHSISGLEFDEQIKSFRSEYQKDLAEDSSGVEFINRSGLIRPVFRRYLDECKPISLTRSNILSQCEISLSDWNPPHQAAKGYAQEALKLIDNLWGAQTEEHLNEVIGWRDAAIADSRESWKAKLGLVPELENKINALFATDDSDRQIKVGQVAAVVKFYTPIYTYVYSRFTYSDDDEKPISHGLEGIVDKYAPLNQQAWQDLLSLTYGAVTWQIFSHFKLAVDRVRQILE